MFNHLPPAQLDGLIFGIASVALLLLVTTFVFWQRTRLLQALREAERGMDPLTSLWSRPRFMELAERQINHVQRTARSAAALIIDLDQCQKINEKYGHHAGDLAVQLLARCAQITVRDYDLLGRYSGEELALLLPDTSIEGASAVALRLRDAIAAQEVTTEKGERFAVTITIGISTLTRESDTLEDLLLAADAALATAKAQGHNRTVAQRIPA